MGMKLKEKRKNGKNNVKKCRSVVLPALLLTLLPALCLSACLLAGYGTRRETPSTSPDPASGTLTGRTDSGEMIDDSLSGSGADSATAHGSSPAKDQAEGPDDADAGKKPKSGAKKVQAHKGVFRVGDSLQDGALKLTYMGSGEYQEESEYQQPAEGSKYIFLQFAFENTDSDRECPVSLFAFQCFADGFAVPAYYGGEKELPASLSPGRYAIGNLYFTVPADAAKIEVEYQPDQSSAGRIRFPYEGEKSSAYQPQVQAGPTKGAFRPGETAQSDLQSIRYLSCREDDSDNENVHPAEGCTYYTLEFEFENLQDEDRQISVHDFSCYADGRSCPRTLFRDDYLSADLPGGRKAKGTVTFEIPDQAKTVEVEYDTGHRGDDRVLFTVR